MPIALFIIIILLALVVAMGILILFGLRNINARLDELSPLTPPKGAAIPTFKTISHNPKHSDSATQVGPEIHDENQSRVHLKEEVRAVQAKLSQTSPLTAAGLAPAQPFQDAPGDSPPLTVPCPNCSYVHVIRDLTSQRRYVCPECQTPIEIEEED